MGEKGDKLREMASLADEEQTLVEEQKRLSDELKRSWLSEQNTTNHFDIEKKFAVEYSISLSDAKKQLNDEFKKYEVEGKDIPSLISPNQQSSSSSDESGPRRAQRGRGLAHDNTGRGGSGPRGRGRRGGRGRR